MEKVDVVYLIDKGIPTLDTTYNEYVYSDVYKRRFARVKSITSKEFYQAESVGMKPEYVVCLSSSAEYNGEKEVVWNNLRFKVLKSYVRQNDVVELTIYGGVHDVRTEVGYTN